MKHFDVLNRNLDLHQHFLLEASAGTGKTFSIQNIVVRLLIESTSSSEPIPLQKMLIVTFTRAATRELISRIQKNIEQALYFLKAWNDKDPISEQAPDYLKSWMDKGEKTVELAQKRLQQALFSFDQAQIFTIHSFCARMLRQYPLESEMGLQNYSGEDPLQQSELMTVIRDNLRTEIREDLFSPEQLDILLKNNHLESSILKLIQKGIEIRVYPTFTETLKMFNRGMKALKEIFSLTSIKVLEDFNAQSHAYKNHKGAVNKADSLNKISHFAKLFDKEECTVQDVDELIRNGLIWLKVLDPDLLKGKPPNQEDLHYPNLTQHIQEQFGQLISDASNPAILLARMAESCRTHFRRNLTEEEKLAPDDFIERMRVACDYPSFRDKVQNHYQVAIIDEFQDTDPLQWQIFKTIFLSREYPWNGYLYLVGDPKQSIYSFRQADIYTYLDAARLLGESQHYSLNINYRSQSNLIEALNILFDESKLAGFIPLPKISSHLLYQKVQAAPKGQNSCLKHDKGAVHFFIADADAMKKPKLEELEIRIFFPFIANEILHAKMQDKMGFRQFAILVRDKGQMQRLADYFDQTGIPYVNPKSLKLTDTPAMAAIIDLLYAINHQNDRAAMLACLGSPIFEWNHDEIKDPELIDFAYLLMQKLRNLFSSRGFASFFQELLNVVCKPNGQKVQHQILEKVGGLEFYRNLQQIADLIAEHQFKEWSRPEGIIPFLDSMKTWNDDDARLKRLQDPSADSVKILTMHSSKGLEFDVVFALGLVNRDKYSDVLIPVVDKDKPLLSAVREDSNEYRLYCEERDAEKMRLLYVALTRAKIQLFIPAIINEPLEKIDLGESSPINLFLGKLIGQPTSYHDLYQKIRNLQIEDFFHYLETIGKSHHMTYSVNKEFILNEKIQEVTQTFSSLSIPSHAIVSQPKLSITSFTALLQRSLNTGNLKDDEQTPGIESFSNEIALIQSNAPSNYEVEIRNVHTLPSNRETGIFIHSLLEKISYSDFKNLNCIDDAKEILKSFLHKTIFEKWGEVIALIIYNTLKINILPEFCLADLNSNQLMREMPFLFSHKDGLIKGVIDCVFQHKGLYYLIDWKTNWLGSSFAAYEPDFLKCAMKENKYDLQASIYVEALMRYLNLVDKRSFESCFGGVFYLFLRGLTLDGRTGVHYFSPDFNM